MQRRRMLQVLAAGTMGTAAGPATARLARSTVAEKGSSIVARDGTRLFRQEWGAGRPMVFVHSWGLSSAIWDRQVTALSREGCRCVTYDRRGHGRSDVPARGYDLDTLADDLSHVVEQLDLRDAVLVGHSMGSAEIVRYLSRHGAARIARIVLVAPTTPYLLKTADNPYGAPAEYFDSLRAQWDTDFPQWVEDNKRPFFTPETSAATMDWLARLMLSTPLPVLRATNVTLVETDLRPDLGRIDLPVTVLHGDRDVSAPLDATGRRTVAGLPRAELKVYAGAPHGLFVTHARQVGEDLLRAARS